MNSLCPTNDERNGNKARHIILYILPIFENGSQLLLRTFCSLVQYNACQCIQVSVVVSIITEKSECNPTVLNWLYRKVWCKLTIDGISWNGLFAIAHICSGIVLSPVNHFFFKSLLFSTDNNSHNRFHLYSSLITLSKKYF